MSQYIGFSTINANQPRSTSGTPGPNGGTGTILSPIIPGKKFKLVDEQLVLRDFLNALNIQQGQKVGQPEYGTTLWSFAFEPNTIDVQDQLEREVTRVASLDPRLDLNYVKTFAQEHGILIEVQLSVLPFNNVETLSIFLDSSTRRASKS